MIGAITGAAWVVGILTGIFLLIFIFQLIAVFTLKNAKLTISYGMIVWAILFGLSWGWILNN